MVGLATAGLQVKRGRITNLDEDGSIRIEDTLNQSPITCYFLKTTAGSIPALRPGDEVLYISGEAENTGYILGTIETNLRSPSQEPLAQEQAEPEKARIRLNAEERIELKCGKSTLVLKSDGRIVLKGVNVTTRAGRLNKIRGAVVQIN